MTPTKRELSGIFFRQQKEDGTWDNVVFEELPKEERRKIMEQGGAEFTMGLADLLADILLKLGDMFDIYTAASVRESYETYEEETSLE